jgi:tetratricopeptide (TPR) repeat protein
MLKWLSGGDAAEVGTALADDFVLHTAPESGPRRKEKRGSQGQELQKFLSKFLQQVDRDTRKLKLNIFRRASLANSFKWRLLEKGVEPSLVEELTQALVLRLTTRSGAAPLSETVPETAKRAPGREAVQALLTEAAQHITRGAHEEAVDCLEQALAADPRHFAAHNMLGIVLCRLGRYHEGGEHFRHAIRIKESYPEAHFALGSLLRSQGRIRESEQPLRRALKLKPTLLDAQASLASTLHMLGRTDEARSLFEKLLRVAPRNVDALSGLGQLCALEGKFAEAETWFNRALEADPKWPLAWVGLAGLRKMTVADSAWLKGAEASADSGLSPLQEASIRTAIGKYYDQIGDFAKAFRSFQRAKELVKTASVDYDSERQARMGDTLISAYGRELLARPQPGASQSSLPILVVGMPRSGSTLVEQIVASHPAVRGAGEIEFWGQAIGKQPSLLQEPPDAPMRRRLAESYLRALSANSANAGRVVDKTLSNAQILGLVHNVFPNARILHMQRDPIDTCLSCYFQDFPAALNFTLDLSHLAHFYREQCRLMEHWRSVLPPGTLLDVPYEELLADQEGWTRRILEFLGLPWDERCLSFHSTERSVLTASYWQVRQKVYKSSVGRWRNYEKFIGPLRELR